MYEVKSSIAPSTNHEKTVNGFVYIFSEVFNLFKSIYGPLQVSFCYFYNFKSYYKRIWF